MTRKYTPEFKKVGSDRKLRAFVRRVAREHWDGETLVRGEHDQTNDQNHDLLIDLIQSARTLLGLPERISVTNPARRLQALADYLKTQLDSEATIEAGELTWGRSPEWASSANEAAVRRYVVLFGFEHERHQGMTGDWSVVMFDDTAESLAREIAGSFEYEPRVIAVHVVDLDTGQRVEYQREQVITLLGERHTF